MAVVNGIYVAICGDVIQAARELVPDPSGTLPQPTATAVQTSATGSTLPAGTYACIVTQWNYFGETIGATEVTGIAIGANQGILVTSTLLPGATKIRAYLTLPGGAAGTECQYVESTVSPFTISTPLTGAGLPPTRNTAFNPDTDGNFASASMVYRYLNDGLKILSRATGGLLDYAGVGSTLNQPLYQIPQQWNEITSVWYDGYWLTGGDRGQFFRRNTITSQVLASATLSVIDSRNILEVYPQPARTGAVTTLSGSISSTDTTLTLTDASGFLLPFGFVSVDSEIMAYATINGNQLTGLIRGLGGSTAIAHSGGAASSELNIFWSGKRQFAPTFQPGNAASALPIPNGWDTLLINYVGGRLKLVEHDGQSFQQLEQDMQAQIKQWALTNRGVVRRRQVGPGNSPITYGNTLGGGLIVN